MEFGHKEDGLLQECWEYSVREPFWQNIWKNWSHNTTSSMNVPEIRMRILLTNEPRYWETPVNPPKRKNREFRVHRGRKLSRRMDWQSDTAKRTKKPLTTNTDSLGQCFIDTRSSPWTNQLLSRDKQKRYYQNQNHHNESYCCYLNLETQDCKLPHHRSIDQEYVIE